MRVYSEEFTLRMKRLKPKSDGDLKGESFFSCTDEEGARFPVSHCHRVAFSVEEAALGLVT